MSNLLHIMKTISIRELHNKTGDWVRSVNQEKQVIVTDRGVAVAVIQPLEVLISKTYHWQTRPLVPGFKSSLDKKEARNSKKIIEHSTDGLSQERDEWR